MDFFLIGWVGPYSLLDRASLGQVQMIVIYITLYHIKIKGNVCCTLSFLIAKLKLLIQITILVLCNRFFFLKKGLC